MTAEIHTRSSSGGLKQQLMLPGYRYPVRGGGLGGGSVPQPDAARQPSLTSASIRQRRRNIRSLDDACIPRLFFWGGGKGGGGISVHGEKTCRRTQQCRGLCQSPPPTLIKCFCIVLPRGSRCAPSRSPQYPLLRETNRRQREREEPAGPAAAAAAPAAMLQPRNYGQGIPKLEGANIWCGALVLGPPQKGPVLSGNLVIFSASLARLQL